MVNIYKTRNSAMSNFLLSKLEWVIDKAKRYSNIAIPTAYLGGLGLILTQVAGHHMFLEVNALNIYLCMHACSWESFFSKVG